MHRFYLSPTLYHILSNYEPPRILDRASPLLHILQTRALRIQLQPIHQIGQLLNLVRLIRLGHLRLHREQRLLQRRLVLHLSIKLVILRPVLLCVRDHLVDVVRREPSLLGLDLGAGLGLRDLIARAHVEDAVCVEGEGHVDLGLAGARALDSGDDEGSEFVVRVDVGSPARARWTPEMTKDPSLLFASTWARSPS